MLQFNQEMADELALRRQLEIELRKNQNILAAIMENAPVNIYVKDAAGVYLLMSRSTELQLGIAPGYALGKSDYDLLSAETAADVRADDLKVLHSATMQTFAESVPLVDGLHTYYSVKFPLPPIEGGPASLAGVSLDISEHKRADEALGASEERFAKVFRANPLPIALVRGSDGVLLDVNGAWESMLGYQRDEVCGRAATELQLWADAGDEAMLGAKLAEQGSIHDLELQLRRKDGALRECSLVVEVVDIRGESCLVTILRDITERKQQEEQLKIIEWRYRALAQNYPNGAVLLYDQELRYILADGAGLSEGGFSKEMLEGRTIWEAFPAETAAFIEPLYRAALEGRPSQVEVPYEGRTYLQHALPIRDEHGEVVAGMISTQNITIAKQMEQEHAARLAAEESSQSKSIFLSRMSHELRTPLNSILGFAQLLEMEDPTPVQQESIDFILAAGKSLLQLVDEILGVVNIERGQFGITAQPVRILDSVCAALAPLQEQADQKGLKITIDIAAASAVIADPARLLEIFQQLLSNAVKFNRVGGSVQVSSQNVAGPLVRVEIVDSGLGLSAEQLGRIFTPFERLGAETAGIEGVGMGLVLAQSLVESMNGRIGADSVPGIGSTFWLELPGPVR